MHQDEIKALVDGLTSQYLWWFVGAACAMYAKEVLENLVSGVTFMFNRDYNVDDEVLIGGNRRARIVRRTMTKTVFHMYDNNTRLVVPNKEIHTLRCETKLPGS